MLDAINFGWNRLSAGEAVNGQTFAGNSIMYADEWIYVRENLGIARVNANTGLAQFAASGRIFGTQSPILGRFSTSQDTYQCLTAYDVTGKWLVHNGLPVRGWHAGAEQMGDVQVWRVDGPIPVYVGQIETGMRGDSQQPVIVGDTAYIRESALNAGPWTVIDLTSLTLRAHSLPILPVAIDGYGRRVDRQNSIDGATYELSVAGRTNDGTQVWTLRKSGTVIPNPTPTPTPTPEPQPPNTEEPSMPGTPIEMCPPGYHRNFMGVCVPDEAPAPTPADFTITGEFVGRLTGSLVAVPFEDLVILRSPQTGKAEVIVKRADVPNPGFFIASMTDVGLKVTVTRKSDGLVKVYERLEGKAPEAVLWF